MKKLPNTSALLLTVLLILLTACGNAQTESNAETREAGTTRTVTEELGNNGEESMIKTFHASAENVKMLGRAYFVDNVLWCAHSGTGAEFSVKGRSVKITIAGDSSVNGDKNNLARIGIYLNGERVVDDMINQAEKTYTIFEGETEKEAVVTVMKLSESAMSCFGIMAIETDSGSEILPTPNKGKLIEFIGDSITCGYGVDDENRDNHFSTSTEDFTKTYAYKTAQILDVDYSAVCFSGYGIISGYTTGEKIANQTVPQYYDKVGYSFNSASGFKASAVEWDFKHQPDIIVINLGTNDDSYCQGNAEKHAEFTAAYIEFLGKVRSLNPDAEIICAVGIMGDRIYSAVEKAVEGYISAANDKNVSCLKFDVQLASDGYAADWHPTEATHTKAAQKLTEIING